MLTAKLCRSRASSFSGALAISHVRALIQGGVALNAKEIREARSRLAIKLWAIRARLNERRAKQRKLERAIPYMSSVVEQRKILEDLISALPAEILRVFEGILGERLIAWLKARGVFSSIACARIGSIRGLKLVRIEGAAKFEQEMSAAISSLGMPEIPYLINETIEGIEAVCDSGRILLEPGRFNESVKLQATSGVERWLKRFVDQVLIVQSKRAGGRG